MQRVWSFVVVAFVCASCSDTTCGKEKEKEKGGNYENGSIVILSNAMEFMVLVTLYLYL